MNETRTSRAALGAVVAGVVVLAAAFGTWMWLRPGAGDDRAGTVAASGVAASSVSGRPEPGPPVALDVSTQAPQASLVLDVHDAAAVKRMLSSNTWLQQTLHEPLGQGFLGSWAGFLSTRGEDLKAPFAGTLGDLAATRLFAQPARVVWLAGTGTPAVLFEKPGTALEAALAGVDKVSRRGTYTADRCPGEGSAASAPYEIARWVVADHAVYRASGRGRTVLARAPGAALAGLCVALEPAQPQKNVALELVLVAPGLGREAQVLVHLLGLGPQPRLQFGIEADTLVPRGIAGEVAVRGRLERSTLDGRLLRLIPEDTAVVASALVNLPGVLDRQALKAVASGEQQRSGRTRAVTLLWNPRGGGKAAPEVALVWGGDQDRAFLEEAFGGKGRLYWKSVCGHEVLASSLEFLGRIGDACERRVAAFADAPPAVTKGFAAKASVFAAVQPGWLLSRLMLDAWAAEREDAKGAPPELDEAARTLKLLPFMGLTGAADGDRLVPGGFRS